MSQRQVLGVGVVLALVGCVGHTDIKYQPKPAPGQAAYVGNNGCMVQDFDNASDLPTGAKSLGWVEVPKDAEETDEAAYVALRKKICDMGGDALSQVAWVKEGGDDRPHLKAMAWSMP